MLELPVPPADLRLAYGGSPEQFGELRLPLRSGPHPVAIVIHGGFWRKEYDLRPIGHLCAGLRNAGIATWNLEYRRIGNPGGGWPGTFEDIRNGAAYLLKLAGRHALDPDRMIAVGHGAGGQLALWLAGQRGAGRARPSSVVSMAGVTNLHRAWELGLGNGAAGELLGGGAGERAKRYREASPASMVPLGVPQRLVHGTMDEVVPFSMSWEYQRAAVAAGDEAQLVGMPGAGHWDLIDPRSAAFRVVRETVLALVSKTTDSLMRNPKNTG